MAHPGRHKQDPEQGEHNTRQRDATQRRRPQRHTKTIYGREGDISRITNMLLAKDHRLISLVSLGGSGKTSLAEAVMNEDVLGEAFQHTAFISLANQREARSLAMMIAAALGSHINTEHGWAGLRQGLKAQASLLVLDNLEHLISDLREELRRLLTDCPELVILATSREVLKIPGEFVYQLKGLRVPGDTQANFERYGATQLFIHKARRLNRHFDYQGHKEAILSICQYLEGWPLGIELAASWVRHHPVAVIAQSLRQNLDFLTSKSRRVTARHASARVVFDYSWALLSHEEQDALAKLAVFHTSFSTQAALEVCSVEASCLEALVDQSLLQPVPSDFGKRFTRHALIYEFSREKLAEHSQQAQLVRQHAYYYLGLAEQAKDALRGQEQVAWLNLLADEHDNLLTSLSFFEAAGLITEALRLALALAWFWDVRGHYQLGMHWLTTFLDDLPAQNSALLSEALYQQGHLAWRQGKLTQATQLFQRSLGLLEDQPVETISLLHHLGLMARDQGQFEKAEAFFYESLSLSQRLDDKEAITWSILNLGGAAQFQYKYPEAKQLLEEALQLSRGLDDQHVMANALGKLGTIAVEQGHLLQAVPLLDKSLRVCHALVDRRGIAHIMIIVATLLHRTNSLDASVMLYAAAQRLCDQLGLVLNAYTARILQHNLSQLRTTLTAAHFDMLHQTGNALPLQDSLDLALAELGKVTSEAAQK